MQDRSNQTEQVRRMLESSRDGGFGEEMHDQSSIENERTATLNTKNGMFTTRGEEELLDSYQRREENTSPLG